MKNGDFKASKDKSKVLAFDKQKEKTLFILICAHLSVPLCRIIMYHLIQ